MIEKQKMIIAFDVKQPSGKIYSHLIAPQMMTDILKNDIGGVILPTGEFDIHDYMNPAEHQFKIKNPKMVLENDVMIMNGDVVFNENVNKPDGYWRLVICGIGEIEGDVVTSLEKLTAINIEIIDEMVYNQLSERVKKYDSN